VQLTEEWLQGRRRIPEIEEKWAKGPDRQDWTGSRNRPTPRHHSHPRRADVEQGRSRLSDRSARHDSELGGVARHRPHGREIFSTGTRDAQNFIAPGTFLFKAEPVDQHGNLIDRHNLWEMVGVRFRRALFPAYSDTVEYQVSCSGLSDVRGAQAPGEGDHRHFQIPKPTRPGRYTVVASLQYRKVDQFLVNYLLGPRSGITARVVEIGRAAAAIDVSPDSANDLRLVAISQ
jgi:hypothetical protein